MAGSTVGRISVTRRALPALSLVPCRLVGDVLVLSTLTNPDLGSAAAGAVVAFETGEFDDSSRAWWTVHLVGVGRSMESEEDHQRLWDARRPRIITYRVRREIVALDTDSIEGSVGGNHRSTPPIRTPDDGAPGSSPDLGDDCSPLGSTGAGTVRRNRIERHRGGSMIKVFLLDDSEIVRRGVRDLLEASGHIEVVGEAGTASEALRRVPLTAPDVAVLDVCVSPMGTGSRSAAISGPNTPISRASC